MSIIRVEKEHRRSFVIVDRRVVDDARLSWKARGLHVYLMGRPDHWEVSPEHLSKQSPGGIGRVRSALKELEKLGYAEYRRERVDGKFCGSTWLIFEVPPDRDSGFVETGETRKPTKPGNPRNGRQANNNAFSEKNEGSNNKPPPARTDDVSNAAAPSEKGKKAATMLTVRGIAPEPVALDLVQNYEIEHVLAMIERFDFENTNGAELGAGWLRRAITEGYEPLTEEPSLIRYSEALVIFETLSGPFHNHFETVKTDSGTLFRRRKIPVEHP